MRLTPKQRVLRKFPLALCYRTKGAALIFYETVMGWGFSPAGAWADAARRLK